jgi:uncharacterized SAM-binding protein YcdF (DUF218 family)
MRAVPDYPLRDVVADLNRVAAFLALGDGPGPAPADVLVLLGNSVLAVAEKAFAIFQAGAARKLLIAGGRGHSTRFLEQNLQNDVRYASIASYGKSEAELLGQMATEFWRIEPERMLLDMTSSNCGENALFALRTLQDHGVEADSLILMQDPTMQRRTDATFRKVWREAGLTAGIVNDPTWVPQLSLCDGGLEFARRVAGCWPVERFTSLVMGEIPRLRDDEAGYGPKGQGLIEHVDIPQIVLGAHTRLAASYPEFVRQVWTGEVNPRLRE